MIVVKYILLFVTSIYFITNSTAQDSIHNSGAANYTYSELLVNGPAYFPQYSNAEGTPFYFNNW